VKFLVRAEPCGLGMTRSVPAPSRAVVAACRAEAALGRAGMPPARSEAVTAPTRAEPALYRAASAAYGAPSTRLVGAAEMPAGAGGR